MPRNTKIRSKNRSLPNLAFMDKLRHLLATNDKVPDSEILELILPGSADNNLTALSTGIYWKKSEDDLFKSRILQLLEKAVKDEYELKMIVARKQFEQKDTDELQEFTDTFKIDLCRFCCKDGKYTETGLLNILNTGDVDELIEKVKTGKYWNKTDSEVFKELILTLLKKLVLIQKMERVGEFLNYNVFKKQEHKLLNGLRKQRVDCMRQRTKFEININWYTIRENNIFEMERALINDVYWRPEEFYFRKKVMGLITKRKRKIIDSAFQNLLNNTHMDPATLIEDFIESTDIPFEKVIEVMGINPVCLDEAVLYLLYNNFERLLPRFLNKDTESIVMAYVGKCVIVPFSVALGYIILGYMKNTKTYTSTIYEGVYFGLQLNTFMEKLNNFVAMFDYRSNGLQTDTSDIAKLLRFLTEILVQRSDTGWKGGRRCYMLNLNDMVSLNHVTDFWTSIKNPRDIHDLVLD